MTLRKFLAFAALHASNLIIVDLFLSAFELLGSMGQECKSSKGSNFEHEISFRFLLYLKAYTALSKYRKFDRTFFKRKKEFLDKKIV